MRRVLAAAVPGELGDLPGLVLGVGPIAAAASAGRLLARGGVDELVLVGSAGSFAGGPEPGEVISAGRLGLADPTVTLGLGYVPLAPAPLSVEPFPGLPVFNVLTRLGVTTDLELAGRLGADGPWQVEHMEAYAVAWACAAAGVRFRLVLGIANRVGPSAHREWRERHVEVEAAARQVVAQTGRFLAPDPSSG